MSYSLKDIYKIKKEFYKELDGYSYKKYIINDMSEVVDVENSLVLYIEVVSDKITVLNQGNGEKYGDVFYSLEIEEVSYNDIGFKHNNTKFVEFISKRYGDPWWGHITYTRFKGWARLYWCPETPTLAEQINKLLPCLKLRERYEKWCGILYYIIPIEFTAYDGHIERARLITTGSPNAFVNNFVKNYIKDRHIHGDCIRNYTKLEKAINSWKGECIEKRFENHMKYFYVQKYFKEKDDVWRYADKVLEDANNGVYDYAERICYTPSKTRWINEELVYNLTKKIFKEYNIIPHHSPSFLISSFGGQMHYDVFIAKLNIAIEYQGKQHFEPVDYFGGEESFKKCRQRDIDKKKLSDEHGVGLIYINYNEEITVQLIKERATEVLKQLSEQKAKIPS